MSCGAVNVAAAAILSLLLSLSLSLLYLSLTPAPFAARSPAYSGWLACLLWLARLLTLAGSPWLKIQCGDATHKKKQNSTGLIQAQYSTVLNATVTRYQFSTGIPNKPIIQPASRLCRAHVTSREAC